VSSTLFHRPGTHAKTLRVMSAVGGCAVVALLASGCGGATAGTAASSASATPSQGASAYLTCLRQHGVNIPTTRPTARPTTRPTARPSGGFAATPAMQKARQACASLRPAGGFGGGQFAAAFQAFRSCMAAHGETIPTTRPTAPATPPSPGTDRFLNGLNPSDPKVAAALKACQSKLPRFPGATPSPSAG
jgi:hypothetical protein